MNRLQRGFAGRCDDNGRCLLEELMKNSADAARSHRIERVDWETFVALWDREGAHLNWNCPFVIPPWIEAWLETLGQGIEPFLAVLREKDRIVGIAPLATGPARNRFAFLGDPDVCDYFDGVIEPGREREFFRELLGFLGAGGAGELDLGPVRSDSAVARHLGDAARSLEFDWEVASEAVSSELELPDSWEDFLSGLTGKERHELRRKLRRFEEAGNVGFRKVESLSQVSGAIETFISLFGMNRDDKAAFMTPRMAAYFRALSGALSRAGLLRLFFLDLNGRPVASALCFDHAGVRYLYNNGYDETERRLSVGLLSKVLSLKDAIETGLSRYDFLKGAEAYKQRLGGREIELLRYRVRFPGGYGRD